MQTMNFERITPQVAQTWLGDAGQSNFRKLDSGRVARMADAIKNTGWVNDGLPFRFNSSGTLIDGQHRAGAIAKSGVTVHAWVCRGVDDDTTIDSGQSRTLSQILRRNGEKSYATLATTLGNIWKYQRNVVISNATSKISNAEALLLLQDEPEIRNSVVKGQTANDVMSASMVAMVHFFASKGDKKAADQFVEQLSYGTNLERTSPIHHLRERMMKDRSSKMKLIPYEKLALLIIAWNYWFAGRGCSSLRWRNHGDRAQAFPRINVTRDSDEFTSNDVS